MSDEHAPGSIVEALGEGGLAKLEAAGERLTLEPGTVVYEPGDPMEHQYLLLSGAIEVSLVLDGGLERLVGTLREGALLGALAADGSLPSAGRCRVTEATDAVKIGGAELRALLAGDDALALRVLPAMMAQMGKQARIAIDDLVTTAHWAAQVSGISQLSFGDILASADGVTLRLTDGRTLAGRIVRVDLEESGGFLVLRDVSDTLHVVRGAGIVSIERPPVSGPTA